MSPVLRVPSAGFDFARYTDEKIIGQLGYSKVAGFPSMYVKNVNGKLIVLGVYVDDLYMTGDLNAAFEKGRALAAMAAK